MIKDIRAKIYRAMGVGCLSCSLVGLLTSPGLTQDCARPQIDTYITQFNDRDSTPLNAVSQCGVSAVPSLIEALKHPNDVIRASAVEALGKIGPEAKAAVPSLIQALKDRYEFVRAGAAEALGKIGTDANSVVPHLIQALKDDNGFVRRSAAEALGRMGSDANSVVPHLIQVVKNEKGFIRASAIEALGKIGTDAKAAIPVLIEAFEDNDRQIGSAAASALGQIGADAIPQLRQALKDENKKVYSGAASALGQIGVAAIPVLVEALKDRNEYVRVSAALGLREMGSSAGEAIPALIQVLQGQDEFLGQVAAFALGNIGRDAVPLLVKVLQDEREYVRVSAISALGSIGSEAESAVPALLQILNDESKGIRIETIRTLGKIGFVDRGVISALIQVFKDEDKDVRQVAATTLGKFGVDAFPALVEALKSNNEEISSLARVALQNMNSEMVPVLIEALNNQDEWVRYAATYALSSLWYIGSQAEAAIPALIEVLTDKNENVRAFAVNALGKMGSQAQAAVPALIVALEDENSIVRFNAAYALAWISPTTTEAVPILIEALNKRNFRTRREVVVALGQFNSEAKAIVPVLIKALTDENKDVRVSAANALGSIGVAAQAAIPDLREALHDPDSDVRSRADFALKKITPESTSAQNPTTPDSQLTNPVEVRQIQVKGSTLLSDAEINQIIQPFEGRSMTLAELRTITDAITQLYLEQGYVTARALLEEKPITDGIVQIRVLEGRLNLTDALGTQPVRLFQLSSPLSVASEASLFEQLQARAADTGFEQAREQQFEELFGTNLSKRLATAESIGETLADITRQTQTKPAVIYVNFIPAAIAPEISLERPQQQDSDQLELVLITADSQPIRKRVEVSRVQIIQAFRKLAREISDPRKLATTSYLESAQQVYQWLIAPLATDLEAQDIDTLVFSLDISLTLVPIPLAALHDGQQFLVEKYSTGLIPSFSLTDTRYVDIKNFQVLAMGASKFQDLPPLPSIPFELSIVTNIWSGKSLLDEAFTLQNLKSQGRQKPFRIIHLGTHAEFKRENPSNSYIQLWDTKLRLNQIQQLGWNDPPVELLVLNTGQIALNTGRSGLGDKDTEFGFSGLAVQAGVKSVLSTIWYESDVGTLGMMAEFYQQLKTAPTKAEALRQAQLAMLKGQVRIEDGQLRWSRGARIPLTSELSGRDNPNFSHPYYWAAYTLVGSPW